MNTKKLTTSHKVTAKLINGSEAEAVVAVMMSANPTAIVKNYTSYLSLENEGSLIFNLRDIGEELGRKYDVPTFLTILASYSGQIDVDDDVVSIVEMA